ncbi:MAG TPA: hypothetical protein P5205_08800 [Candidatus Paceibacterota bacterium]|nr:hypothetical protein [Verrucomicrobiota bacterium]HSA10454.1 hypothetical protein [Candidatus Paceibacterota bacterium]
MYGWQKRDEAANLPPGRLTKLVPLLAAALITVCFVSFPSAPPDNDVDSSLSAGLNYAQEEGLQFGSDLVFTYGPLGFLMFYYYSPCAAGWRMAADVAYCLATAVGLCLLAWRLRPLWRWGLLLLFLWIAPNIPTRADLVINIGLLSWSLLCLVESGYRLLGCLLAFAVLAAFAALAKISFLFTATVGVAVVAGDLALHGRWRLAVGMTAGFGTAFVLGWAGAGQAFASLGAYLANGLAVARAYNGALGWEGPVLLQSLCLALALVVLVMIILRVAAAFEGGQAQRTARLGLLLAWLLLLSFAAWKYGSVRSGREVYFLGFIAVLAFGLETLPGEGRVARRWARGLALGVCGLSLITMQVNCFAGWPGSFRVPFRTFGQNLSWLMNPAGYRCQMEEALGARRREAQLPRCTEQIGRASADVFGHWQAYALHNGWNYRPRPVFQSYVACSRALMQLNESFYLSKAAPEYVLFRLFALDRKFPSLEDAMVLRTLLANYQPIAAEDRFLLLRRIGTKRPVLSLVREGTVQPGQAIDLREFGNTDLWLEISLQPTLLGRLRQALYRPPTVRLAAWREPGGKLMVRNRAPAQMLAAGFLASPLLLNNDDVLNLYADRAVARPGACSVELLPGEGCYWQETIHYRIHKVQSRLGRCVPADLAEQLSEQMSGQQAAGQSSLNASPSAVAAPASPAKHLFRLFPVARWRPAAPLPGGWQENVTFGLFLAAPMASIGLLLVFVRRGRRGVAPTGWGRLVIGNALVLACLVTPVLLVGETYFRFCCDTTDSLAFTRISERWVQRHWRVNGAGSRDNLEYSPALTSGRRRISFVGDSFTAGHGIKDVGDRFANRLRQAHPDWEIHLLASVGLDTGGEMTVMKKAIARGYQLDQVVLVYCLNDIGDLLPPQADATRRILAELDNSGWLVRNSYMMNLWYHHYRASRDPYLGNYCAFVREAYNGAVWERQQERLKAFRDLVQAQGGRLAAVTFPFLHALGPNYEYRPVHVKLDELWHELGVPHLDLLEVLEGLPPSRLTVNRYDAHPNEYAHQLATAAIDQWLQKLMAIRPRPD